VGIDVMKIVDWFFAENEVRIKDTMIKGEAQFR
jgi:hypothetical protein